MPHPLIASTSYVWFVLAVRDHQDIWCVEAENLTLPGYILSVDPAEPLGAKLARWSEEYLKTKVLPHEWYLEPDFHPKTMVPPALMMSLEPSDTAPRKEKVQMVLQVVRWDRRFSGLAQSWQTIPKILPGMLSGEYRRLFLLTWQVLMGANREEECRVVIDGEGSIEKPAQGT